MIQIIDQSTSHTPDGKTRLTLTLEIPAREQIGAPLDLERGLPKALSEVEGQRALNGIGQEVMNEALSRYDTEGEPIRFGSFAMTSRFDRLKASQRLSLPNVLSEVEGQGPLPGGLQDALWRGRAGTAHRSKQRWGQDFLPAGT